MRLPIRDPVRSPIRQTFRLVQRLIPTFTGTEYGDMSRNLLSFTEEFDNAVWGKAGGATVTANTAIAPDGTLTADTVTISTGGSAERLAQTVSVADTGQSMAMPIFVKDSTIGKVSIRATAFGVSALESFIDFDMVAKTFSGATNIDSASFDELADGWFRLNVVFSLSNVGNTDISYRVGGGFAGSPTGDFFAWGAQLEQSSSAGTYIKPIEFTGDFEVEVEFATTADTTFETVVGGREVNTDEIIIDVKSGAIRALAFDGGTLRTILTSALGFADGKIHKAKLVLIGTAAELFVDGASVDTAVWPLTNPNAGFIGRRPDGTNTFNGQLLSVKLTDQSGATDDVTQFIFDSGSTVEEVSRGVIDPSGKRVDMVNFSSTNWERFIYSQNPKKWTAEDGSPVLEIA